jgi:hypothetical protein
MDPYKFSSRTNSTLSNFFWFQFVIWNIEFHSLEQAYQYFKAIAHHKLDKASRILKADRVFQVYLLGKSIRTGAWWKNEKSLVMEHLLREKFKQCKVFREELLSTGDAILMEDTPNKFWGCGRHGSVGLNTLGVLLMSVRCEGWCEYVV